MPFPTSPTNGQLATINGITYAYSSAKTSWKKVTSAVGNLAITNTLTIGTVSATGNITSSGNITANYFIGDGSKLTNINAASTGKAIAMSIVFGG